MESTPAIVIYAPLILAGVSALGFVVTVAVLIVSRVFRLGKFFADFTTLQETVAANHSELQQAIADNKSELQQAIADSKADISELRQELRDSVNRIEAGLQELRGYFVAHLEHHAGFAADDD